MFEKQRYLVLKIFMRKMMMTRKKKGFTYYKQTSKEKNQRQIFLFGSSYLQLHKCSEFLIKISEKSL